MSALERLSVRLSADCNYIDSSPSSQSAAGASAAITVRGQNAVGARPVPRPPPGPLPGGIGARRAPAPPARAATWPAPWPFGTRGADAPDSLHALRSASGAARGPAAGSRARGTVMHNYANPYANQLDAPRRGLPPPLRGATEMGTQARRRFTARAHLHATWSQCPRSLLS